MREGEPPPLLLLRVPCGCGRQKLPLLRAHALSNPYSEYSKCARLASWKLTPDGRRPRTGASLLTCATRPTFDRASRSNTALERTTHCKKMFKMVL